MSPHDTSSRRHPPRSVALTVRWDRYLATGSRRAQGDLLQEVDRFVRIEAKRLLGQRHPLYEEAAQEALVGVARRLGAQDRPDFPAAYVRKIVSHKVADLLDRETRRRAREEQQWAPELEPIEASISAEWHDFLDTLRTIVSTDEYWTLLLRYHFDYSYGEIGQLLDKEPNAIRQIALRGRRKCKEHLSRLQGRVPGWVVWLAEEPPSARGSDAAAAEVSDVGDHRPSSIDDSNRASEIGSREPRSADPADRLRRPPAGSDSGTPKRRRFSLSRRRGVPSRRRALGTPLSVLPLVAIVALPILIRLDGLLATPAPQGTPSPLREAVQIERGGPPGGPTRSTDSPTAPTVSGEAPSRSAADPPTTVRPAEQPDSPPGPDPPTGGVTTSPQLGTTPTPADPAPGPRRAPTSVTSGTAPDDPTGPSTTPPPSITTTTAPTSTAPTRPSTTATESVSIPAQPTTTPPTTAQPATSRPTTSPPTTAQPATSRPTTSPPTTAQPATSRPTTSPPTTAQPATSRPTTAPPTSQPPTTAPTRPTTSETTTSTGRSGRTTGDDDRPVGA